VSASQSKSHRRTFASPLAACARIRTGSSPRGAGLVVAAILAVGCSTAVDVHTSVNPNARFNEYKTFSMATAEGPPPGYAASPRTEEIERRLMPLVEATMAQRGYVELPSKADLVVAIGAGRRPDFERDTSSVSAGWLPDDERRDVVAGAIVIDVFDRGTKTWIWHGAGFGVRDPGMIDNGQIAQSVKGILDGFPRASASADGR
jgi:hypothetical protein